MKNKLKLLSRSIILSFLAPQIASAAPEKENGDWIIRTRGIYMKTDAHSRVSTLGGSVAATSDRVPEIDFTRFFSKNIAAELILATTTHGMSLNGSSSGGKKGLGSVRLLPPTLTLQYHVMPTSRIRPYVGAGLNYTIFYGEKTGGIATSMKYQNNLGYALQVGADYMINDKVGFNFDVKKIFLQTNVQVNNTYTAVVNLDPWVVGAGIAYHF